MGRYFSYNSLLITCPTLMKLLAYWKWLMNSITFKVWRNSMIFFSTLFPYYLIWFLGIFFASLWTNLNFKVSPFKSASNSQASLSLSYSGIPIGLGGTTGTSTWLTWKIFVLFQFPMKTNLAILYQNRGARYVTDFDRCFSKAYFFNSNKSTLLRFLIRQTPSAHVAHVACFRAGTWATWA